jgi:hypothetical protein
MLLVREKKGRWIASVLAQKAQVGKRVLLSCTSHKYTEKSTQQSVFEYLIANAPHTQEPVPFKAAPCVLPRAKVRRVVYVGGVAHMYTIIIMINAYKKLHTT